MRTTRSILLDVSHFGTDSNFEEPLLEGRVGDSSLNSAVQTLKHARNGNE